MKLSELTYDYLCSVGLSQVNMHSDCSDCVCYIANESHLDQAKKQLSSIYGDVDIIINPNEPWYDQIKINDAKWEEDHNKYINQKAAWCLANGCD